MNAFIGEHTRVGVYASGIFRPGLLNQNHIWIDYKGNEHQLAEMPRDYLLSLLIYIYKKVGPEASESKLVREIRLMLYETRFLDV